MSGPKKISLALLFLAAGLSAGAQERYFSTALTFPLGFRVGWERRTGVRTGVKADVGLEMLQLPAADLFYLVYLLPPDSRMRVNLALGVPTALVSADFGPLRLYPMFSLGGSLVIGWRFPKGRVLDLRLGGGVPFFFGEDKPVLRPMSYTNPAGGEDLELHFWPDLALTLSFPR